MEANQKKKFVCKYCNKRYPCGKSLGGHIRTHMNNGNSAEAGGEAKLNIDKIFSGRNVKKESGLEAGAQSGYGLRENPKRTRRFVDSSTLTLQQEMVCKECGKGFQSLKALCGHMACHSEKEKPKTSLQDHTEISDVKQKLVMDSESDTETSAPSRLRRSKGTGYATIGVYSSSVDVANGSSSVSEIEQEQEEVAMCLMMLSRDSSGCKKGLNSFADSSDNNSVVLEAKSSSIDMKISAKNGVNCVSNGNEFVEMTKAKDRKLKSAELDVSDNSDSGYFRNGPKKAESDASVDGFIRTGKIKKSGAEYESGFEYFDGKLEKSSSKRTELGKDFTKEEDFAQADRASAKYGSRKRAKIHSSSSEFFRNSAQKRNEFECLTCNKVFHSHRSLWGHTASHSKINGCCESINESSENSIETDSFPVQLPISKVNKSGNGKNPTEHNSSGSVEKKLGSKKSKGHECPFCFRVFKSGQALGGHKRSHFVGGSEDKTVVLKQDLDEMPGLIDLNLPAPVEEEAIGDAEFAAQW
ncbi:putative C2H2-like zinc finger protein [Melia azedarach]|uniref:C2H2-like zinc finger protein n=2 Tax=Melia azedarach TaxID=155640 RepID=A0ACC1XL73_MELAZ|nr:putative C2H2-like zinc finger protein [Melia azedarach]KAJ4711450.1 putative C2H2-like zinc finger protein [Melia azedarach]